MSTLFFPASVPWDLPVDSTNVPYFPRNHSYLTPVSLLSKGRKTVVVFVVYPQTSLARTRGLPWGSLHPAPVITCAVDFQAQTVTQALSREPSRGHSLTSVNTSIT